MLSDAYDTQCINGNGTAPNVNGLVNQLTDPTNPTSVADFDDFVEAFADQIDGLWASTLREVSILANVDSYKLSAKKFRDRVIDTGQRGGVSLGDESAASYLARTMGGWSTNKRMPATASNIARGIVYRKGRPGLKTASHPVWANVAIDDIYSDSSSGTRHFSLHVLCGSQGAACAAGRVRPGRVQGRVTVRPAAGCSPRSLQRPASPLCHRRRRRGDSRQ